MYSVTTLDIKGYRNANVPNTFFLQAEATKELTILFSGFAYTADMPALYYPSRYVLHRGSDLLRVEYTYSHHPDFPMVDAEQRAQWLYQDVEAACQVAMVQRNYERFLMIGKSIGTLAMGHVMTRFKRFSGTRGVWLTPLLTNELLRSQIKESAGPGLFVIGTGDRYYDPAILRELEKATGGSSLVVEDADHALEVPGGDVIRSMHVVERLIHALDAFLRATD